MGQGEGLQLLPRGRERLERGGDEGPGEPHTDDRALPPHALTAALSLSHPSPPAWQKKAGAGLTEGPKGVAHLGRWISEIVPPTYEPQYTELLKWVTTTTSTMNMMTTA